MTTPTDKSTNGLPPTPVAIRAHRAVVKKLGEWSTSARSASKDQVPA
jgi:hypothetical protein